MSLANNKKARFNYHVVEKYEAGISLQGTEVKSCRDHKISLQEGFAAVEDGEIFLYNVHIAEYDKGNRNNHAPTRKRKLLLHKREIRKIQVGIEAKGMTLVPLSFYLKRGKIKVELGLCKGKNVVDKRETIKKRQDDIKINRIANKF